MTDIKIGKRLKREFFSQNTVILAKALIGKYLCRNIDGKIIKLMITETEAYDADGDTACHAYKGMTKRNSVLFGESGHAYVYLCYGIYYLFNIVSGYKGKAEGVLLRGVEGYDGPGKLTKALNIDKTFYAEDLTTSSEIWVEDLGMEVEFDSTKRIGINYAEQKDIDRLWRFVVKKKITS